MICFLFPGQGSQKPQMGQPWTEHPSWELVAEASNASGRDIEHLLLNATAEDLSVTRNTQLATYVMSMIALDAVERLGIVPQLVAGHSLGEYSALVAAGALAFDSGAKLVAERSEAMAIAAEESPGAMAALLGIEDEVAERACDMVEGGWVANYNSGGQIVIAGTKDGVARACEVAKEMGAKRAMVIPVGGGFHTPLMDSAKARLKKALISTRFYDAEVPVVANVDATEHFLASDWPGLLLEQLTSPVKWSQTLKLIHGLHPHLLIEMGPGAVLAGLVRRAMPEARVLSVSSPDNLDDLVEAISEAGPLHEFAKAHHGEHLFMQERIVVSPIAGIFVPAQETVSSEPLKEGASITVGEVLGRVNDTEIRSPFEGTLMGIIALEGERVTPSQPLAWLKTEGASR